MHDQRGKIIERARHLLRRSIEPAVYPLSVATEIEAHHVHGEPISYQEATGRTFEPFAVGQAWGGRWDTTWFRVRATIPASWQGAEVALRLCVGHAGMDGFGSEALVWSDRGPEQGLSKFHQEHVVAKKAKGGERIEVLAEAAANPEGPFHLPAWPDMSPDYTGPPLYRLTVADLVVVDRDVYRFCRDFAVVLQLAEQLPPGDVASGRALAALSRSCDLVDASNVTASVEPASTALREVLDVPAGPGAFQLTATGHAHIDTAWLWPVRETVRKCARTFASAVRLMEEYPEYRFVCSQPQQWAWMKADYPQLYERMKERVASGQLEPVGAMWVEADCNIPSGESLVRQIVHGKRFFLEELGVDCTEVWLPDVFGYSASLPQLMALAGVNRFLTQKISWNDTNRFPHNTFWWEGIDGTRVFTHFPPADTYNGAVTVEELRYSERNFKDHGHSGHGLYLYGHGDGGGGPTRDMIETARRFADLDGVPKLRFGRARDYFDEAEGGARDLAVWAGELYFEYHRGTYTTQARTKRGNRKAELALRDAEVWSALLPGAAWPASELDAAWKQLLVNQFHDIIPGSSIAWVYEETERDHRSVINEAERMITEAITASAAGIDTSVCSAPVAVFNSLAHERSELVDIDGRLIPVTVPPLGYAMYDLADESVAAAPRHPARSSPRRLENGILTVSFDDDGLITSIIDHEVDREVIAPGMNGNVLQLFDDWPVQWDAWDLDRSYEARGIDLVGADRIDVVEHGPHRASMRVARSFGASTVTQDIRLVAGSRRIDFVTDVDWHEEHKLLKVAFPVDIHARRATYEIQYGHVERPTHENTSWDAARFEVCAHKWIDLGESGYGVALLNDCKYGHDVHGNVMRLSLLRSPTAPDPQADRGHHSFVYSLLPHAGDFREAGVVRHAYELNIPLRPVALRVQSGDRPPIRSLLGLDNPSMVIEAVKRADAGEGLVVRLYESWGSRGRAVVDASGWLGEAELTGAFRTDLMERPIGPLQHDERTVSLEMHPFEVVTLLLRRGDTGAPRQR